MPTINDATVVASAFDTSGNGGRKLVRLSDGTLISAVKDISAITVRLYKSNDNGTTWATLSSIVFSTSLQDISIVQVGNKVGVMSLYANTSVHFRLYDGAGTAISSSTLETGQTAMGNASIAINDTGTGGWGAWASKNATYPNSFNIRAASFTIAGDGSVTWGAVSQITTFNTTNYEVKNPSICINTSGKVFILGEHMETTSYYITCFTNAFTTRSTLFNGADANFGNKTVIPSSTYAQSNPSAIFVPQSINGLANGRIWVAWHGYDSIDTSYFKLKYAYSDDGGTTWNVNSITRTSTRAEQDVSIGAYKDGKIYLVFSGIDGVGASFYHKIKQIIITGTTPSATSTITNNTTNNSKFPSTLLDFSVAATAPLFLYQDNQTPKVGFYGTWTVTTISVTQGSVGTKSDKSNLLTYTITTDGTMSTITETVNGTTVNTRNVASGASVIAGLTQAQWDAIKYGKYKDVTGGLNTLTVSMGTDTWTYTFDKRLATSDDVLSAVKAVQDSQNTFLPSVKAKLGGAIRGKGGTVNDTDSFDAIKTAIDGIAVKKYATGTVTSSNTTITFTTGGNGTASYYPVTVTGLTFTPRIITVFTSDGVHVTSFNNDIPTNVKIDRTATRNGTSTGQSYILDGTNAYVTNGSFRLPTGVGSNSFTWETIE